MLSESSDWFYKELLYHLVYLGNWFKYFGKKVPIDFFEVWVGQRCSLRCKECCHLIPYADPVFYEMDTVIADCSAFLDLCEIEFFSIVGGEPFCHPELYRLLDFFSGRHDVLDGKIVTNGTVMPDRRTINSLKNLKGKFEVRIDLYPGKEEFTSRFYNSLLEEGIRCHLTRFEEWSWKRLGGPEQERLSTKAAKDAFARCWDKQCYTLANGEFTACPRGILSEHVFSIPKRRFEHMRILDDKSKATSKALIATCMTHKAYKDYCRHCLGMTKTNLDDVTPGVQIT